VARWPPIRPQGSENDESILVVTAEGISVDEFIDVLASMEPTYQDRRLQFTAFTACYLKRQVIANV
jgi:hypothetical protein